ncbi:MAG: PLDc N-terminal domain-containing protein, partial [Butyrivibrio sp.]
MDGKNRIHRKKIISPKVVKILATAVAVILQAAIIIVPYVFFRDYIARINWVFEIISVLVVLYLVKSDMSPVYKIPWIVIIMLFPVFGGVLYIVYGRRHFGKKESVRVNKALVEYHEAIASRPNEHDSLAEENPDIAVQAEYLYRMADAPAYKNTTAQFFPLGDDMLPVMLEELEKAEKFIFMEYFIVEEGEML